MKPPKPTEGVAKHCWGKRRRIAKKTEKGLWKVMVRVGLLVDIGRRERLEKPAILRAGACFWTEERDFRNSTDVPTLYVSLGFDYWGESDETAMSNYWRSHLEDKAGIWKEIDEETGWPTRRAFRNDRHALQLLRKEIRDRKHRTQAPGQRGEG